jgi:hypothetical protein
LDLDLCPNVGQSELEPLFQQLMGQHDSLVGFLHTVHIHFAQDDDNLNIFIPVVKDDAGFAGDQPAFVPLVIVAFKPTELNLRYIMLMFLKISLRGSV